VRSGQAEVAEPEQEIDGEEGLTAETLRAQSSERREETESDFTTKDTESALR